MAGGVAQRRGSKASMPANLRIARPRLSWDLHSRLSASFCMWDLPRYRKPFYLRTWFLTVVVVACRGRRRRR